MEIKRKIEMLVETNRRYVIRQSATGEQISCEVCGEAMLTAEQTAVFFGVKQRCIFQILEKDVVHFTETDLSLVMICLSSMAKELESKLSQNLDSDD